MPKYPCVSSLDSHEETGASHDSPSHGTSSHRQRLAPPAESSMEPVSGRAGVQDVFVPSATRTPCRVVRGAGTIYGSRGPVRTYVRSPLDLTVFPFC